MTTEHVMPRRDTTRDPRPPPVRRQLFSRLDHPEPCVRGAIGSLLCAVAADDPPLIVFPAVVGSDTARADASQTGDRRGGAGWDGGGVEERWETIGREMGKQRPIDI